jgi:alpha-amylase/alpha-mannosidase (GH57 family)
VSRMIVHGHFYQPPRENPWTGSIDVQPSAAPFHDWNERVHAESYRPNSIANIITPEGERTVSNYERMSFDLGPTLLGWLEHVHPRTYARVLEADRSSAARLGHGNGIAQAFHHTILPLSPPHDVRTEVRWGLADFAHRFGRRARGLWLPETAANDAVLGTLIDEGVEFTILSPFQAAAWRDPHGTWVDVDREPVEARVAHRFCHPDGSGRSLALFFYDADIARAIAFERATSSAERLVDLFAARAGVGGAVNAATDGETYGHHHVFGEIGLAYALYVEAPRRGLEPTNYAALLDGSVPEREARLLPGDGSSWSCAHGVGRWREDCGCHTGGGEGWNQAWRAPLRAALEVVKRAADEAFVAAAGGLLRDPWDARDDYVAVVIGAEEIDDLLGRHRAVPLTDADARRAAGLLEMQRYALAMFTSCGWFFSDIAGIETVQIIRYAARTLDLMEALDLPRPMDDFLALLRQARSNDPEAGTGADLFRAVWEGRPR